MSQCESLENPRRYPPNVTMRGTGFYYRPYLGRREGKIKWGKRVRLGSALMSMNELWYAYNRVTKPEPVSVSTPRVHTWRESNPIRSAFLDQRCNAKARGISFEFTFDEWVCWWAGDIDKRGCGADDLVMARHGDVGPYHPDNVYKSKASDNCRLSAKGTNKKKGAGIALPRAS